jgi:2-aminoadipate transaminase
MSTAFADRIADVPRSFIREILKVAVDRSVISFAGGLPNRDLFPVEELRAAADKVLRTDGADALQYATSEGYPPLRELIAERYRSRGIAFDPADILITSGSQQGLDLLGKTLLNEGDHAVIEEPGYLGAIQAFAIYRATFHPVPLLAGGIDTAALERELSSVPVRIYYAVPNFQNPSGITYDGATRRAVADIMRRTRAVFVEDDPYGELRFRGESQPSFSTLLEERCVLLGSFSKIVAPALRIGWMAAKGELMDKLLIAKQASDLHTNSLGQRIIHRYLLDNRVEDHIARIRAAYGRQRDAMVAAIRATFPAGIRCTEPEGGMFLWVTLAEGASSMRLFERAIARKVAFVPGAPFYVGRTDANTMRLNFSSVDEKTIEEGIGRLAAALREPPQAGGSGPGADARSRETG